jgi:hypothetical protein
MVGVAGVGGALAGSAAHTRAGSTVAAAHSVPTSTVATAPSIAPVDDSVDNFLNHTSYTGHIAAFTEVAPPGADRGMHLMFWLMDDGRRCSGTVSAFDGGWDAGCSLPEPAADGKSVDIMTSRPEPVDSHAITIEHDTPMTWQVVGFVRGAATVTVTIDGQPVPVWTSSLHQPDGLTAIVFNSLVGVMSQHQSYQVTARDAEGNTIGSPAAGVVGVP